MFRRPQGLTLIELMIALLIGTILILGLVQVFAASRSAYMLSEGMSRVQENGRFALDFLQRDIRMAGHFGCVNDQAHMANAPVGLVTTFGSHPGLDFFTSIQGYEATGTAPGATLAVAETPATGGTGFTPVLPAEIAAATSNRVNGSDIIALRFLMPEGVPVTAIQGSAGTPVFRFDAARWDVLRSGVENPGLFGVADCLNTVVFQAAAVGSAAGSVTAGSTNPINASSAFTRVFTEGQAMLHRAESVVYYVGLNNGRPSLYRVRFTAAPGGGLTAQSQELIEGVENMQLLYGLDRELTANRPPTGYIDRLLAANGVQTAVVPAADAWRRVGAVQIGLLTVSPDRATAAQAQADLRPLSALGVAYTAPGDGRYRSVYESTIALRNRLYGN
ncbi:pilus assembly protein PilW [Pseudoxanthomonas broegbernensis]|uniref:Pilus assembly protein PilW n=1 Tax=Pseudoxanthomonas broegbernensis TaxID=83619 RepID=A0A7V8K772_9GAMM|nr:PilW family protein [Pseudoxanthomonas broegbernensis]KAF1686197.1 pilus assembly protein PilW [Pseudoxanthomonas broegbernensis]MBB6063864.1 type IV pilus assembly protein PilW [Pseudoxanthomonas broegbernensis]